MSTATLTNNIRDAHRAAVPLIGLSTHDPAILISALAEDPDAGPVFVWDCLNGLYARNQAADEWTTTADDGGELGRQTRNPYELFRVAAGLPDNSYLILLNSHRFLRLPDPSFTQGVINLRDPFSAMGATKGTTNNHR